MHLKSEKYLKKLKFKNIFLDTNKWSHKIHQTNFCMSKLKTKIRLSRYKRMELCSIVDPDLYGTYSFQSNVNKTRFFSENFNILSKILKIMSLITMTRKM
jgi:hypothetical protein